MVDLTLFEMGLFLVALHFLCDYAWQGDWMAKAKSPDADFGAGSIWRHVLFGHATIHGAAVYVVLGVWWLSLAEIATHYVTDKLKCENVISYNQDQGIHLASKAVWLCLALVATQ